MAHLPQAWGDGNSSKPHRLRQQSTTIITAPFQFTTPWHVRWNVDYFQFTDKEPTPNKSPCPGQGMRSERSRDWNKAITFSPNSWAIRQEHWSEWRAHKMCIADCLQCSLGLLWRERSGAVSTADLGVCAHLRRQQRLVSLLSVSTGLHPHLNTEQEESISLRRATRWGDERAPKQQTEED